MASGDLGKMMGNFLPDTSDFYEEPKEILANLIVYAGNLW